MSYDGKLLLIDKPSGMTSFDVIRRLRERIDVKKMGHAGTLDPLASGLLLIGVGSATKKLTELVGLSKVYEADILLGVRTDTGDTDGTILEEADIPEHMADVDALEDGVEGLVGDLELAVPVYSAVKSKGKPLYWRARKGQEVEPPVRTMTVTASDLLSVEYRDDHKVVVRVRLAVASGVYIRSVAEELGLRLGVPATIAGLRRTKIGEYWVGNAKKIEDVNEVV